MTARKLKTGVSPLVIAALVGLALSACHPAGGGGASQASDNPANAAAPQAAVPLDASGPAAPLVPAPSVADLPAAPPAPITAPPAETYAYADEAQAMSSALGDAPPDYAVDAGDGQNPWVWQADDQSLRVAEPLPGGGERYYYYAAGADTPYLVRDNGYSYGYHGGALVVVYDQAGRVVPPALMGRQAEWAGRYLARARRLHQLAVSSPREAVAQANWADRRQAMAAERARWRQQVDAAPDWRAYHDRQMGQEQAKWDLERYRRQAEAARFADQVQDRQAAAKAEAAARQTEARARAEGVWKAQQTRQAEQQQTQARQAAQQSRQDAARQAQLQARSQHQAQRQAADAARANAQAQAAQGRAQDAARQAQAQAQAKARAQAEADRKATQDAARKARTDQTKTPAPG